MPGIGLRKTPKGSERGKTIPAPPWPLEEIFFGRFRQIEKMSFSSLSYSFPFSRNRKNRVYCGICLGIARFLPIPRILDYTHASQGRSQSIIIPVLLLKKRKKRCFPEERLDVPRTCVPRKNFRMPETESIFPYGSSLRFRIWAFRHHLPREKVFCHTLRKGLLRLRCMDYGGGIFSLDVPDHRGKGKNGFLAYETLEEYEKDSCWCGLLCCPVAGRFAKTRFRLPGEIYRRRTEWRFPLIP